uniref:PiggyBac transposable element-derived protein domain-containing protein n=1 Tax=Paramormyrops kingsleyae TaxID=1676925 RepID=A0A3B3R6Z6_9TELE
TVANLHSRFKKIRAWREEGGPFLKAEMEAKQIRERLKKGELKTKQKEGKKSAVWERFSEVLMTRFLPEREPGPQPSADSHSPMSLFKLFFSTLAVSRLCHNTNAQAAKAAAKGRKYKWTDVSITEMYHYIGIVFYMAKMSSITDYWRQNSILTVPFPATVMSRGRYRMMSWNGHIRTRSSVQVYHPRRNLAVDERMVACKAHTGMTQYMNAKPTKWGFKLFVLADSSNGYTMDFSVYTGKNNFPTGHGLSYDAVTSLLDCKFYTSPKLLKDLLSMKFGSARGSVRWIRDGHTRSICTWTTKTFPFPCPAPVTAWGALISDQLLQYYTAQHKTLKWYRKIFLHFLDIAATNAFIFMEQLRALCSDHVPVPGADLTLNARDVATAGRRLCAHCKAVHDKRQNTPWKCQACNVPLCFQLNRNCFQEWHRDV